MSTLEAEMDTEEQVTETVEIIDCGRASEHTRGFPASLLYEGGIPPYNRLF